MSESGGTPAGGAPAATPAPATAAGQMEGGTATPAGGPRRAAPGLSFDRGGMTLNQGMQALLRGKGADAAPAADGAQPAAATEPRRRAAPSPPPAPAARVNGAADGGQQSQPQPQPQPRTPPASAIDAVIAAWRPSAEGDGGQPQRQDSAPQPAPANMYLQGVPLVVAGEQRHFTVPELTEAVHKASDYTNKTKQLAEQARALNERTQTIDQLLPILIPEIERQLAALNGADAEPDWIALSSDPAEYARQNAVWRTRQLQRDGEKARLAQIVQANQAREQQQRAERVRLSHAELARTLPGWGDEKTRNQLVSEIRQWGLKNGFPAGELDNIVEARHIRTLTYAMIGERLVNGAATQPLTVPQVRRGAAPAAPAPAAIRSAQERFDNNPTHKAGVGLLMARRAAARGNGASR